MGTSPRKFYLLDRTVKDIPSMINTQDIQYFENNDIQVVKIPYKGLKKSMCVILPKKKDGLPDFEKTLTASDLQSFYKNMTVEKVNYILPKFTLENEFSLVEPLQTLGLSTAFVGADFSGISTGNQLVINEIIHKTFIEISEKKTEAAAATAAIVIVGYGNVKKSTPAPPPKLFHADHPFLFMVLDDDQNEILFMGKYIKD